MQSSTSSGSNRSGDRTPGKGEKKPRPIGLKLPIPPREEPFGRSMPVLLPLPLPLPLPKPPRVEQQPSHGGQDVDEPTELEKVEILGYGNGGKVYKVRHRKTQTLYALKVVHGNHDLSTRSQILREMDILRRTDSPFVVRCHGVFDRGGEIQFVLEYLDGGSLDNKVGQGRHLPEPFLAEVARQVLHGLRYLHGQKIVHRDIKPSNLLINREGRVKIADFGVSRILSKTLDPCNSCVGTYAYMSPERIDPDKNDGHYDGYAGDIWSLGLTLLECYVGRFPFLSPGTQPDWPTLMCAICYGEPPLPPPTASPEFQSFIGCCLQKEASQRWTAAQLLSHPFIARASGSALQNGSSSSFLARATGSALQNGSSSSFLARASGSALQNGSS